MCDQARQPEIATEEVVTLPWAVPTGHTIRRTRTLGKEAQYQRLTSTYLPHSEHTSVLFDHLDRTLVMARLTMSNPREAVCLGVAGRAGMSKAF